MANATARSSPPTASGLAAGARRHLLDGVGRLRATGWSIVQCAVAGALAWAFATRVLGHKAPFFATVAAIVCLGVTSAQRLRRIGELAVGVTVGVAVADLLVRQIGSGTWQIAVVVALAMAAAQVLDGGALVTSQAALQAVFLTVLPLPPGGSVGRWMDALVGGATALVVAALAPADPRPEIVRHESALIGELADLVDEGAAAIRSADPRRAAAALDRARATQSDLDAWRASIAAGREISRISPLRRRRRPYLAASARTVVGIDHAIRNMRVALRHVEATLERGEALPSRVAGVLEDLAAILRAMRHEVAEVADGAALAGASGPRYRLESEAALRAFAPRLDLAGLCADNPGSPGGLGATVIVASVRSATVDLLGCFGVDAEEARDLLPR